MTSSWNTRSRAPHVKSPRLPLPEVTATTSTGDKPGMTLQPIGQAVSSALCVAAVAAMGLGAGAASADTGQEQRQDCHGASPRFGETYRAIVKATQIVEPQMGSDVGLLIQHSTTFQAPFQVSGSVAWKNEATGTQGSQNIASRVERQQLFAPNFSVATGLTIKPGRGPLTVTVKLQPSGAPQLTCVGHFTVR